MGNSLPGGESILGNLGAAANHKSQASVQRSNARVARAQGRAARGQAYGAAVRVEAENELAGQQAAMNLERLRANETSAQGAVRAARGGSGFTAAGSGSLPEISVLRQFEQRAMDLSYSRALQDQGARFQAAMGRTSGDLAMLSAEVNAGYQDAQAGVTMQLAKNAKHAATTTAVMTAIGAALGGFGGAAVGASIASGANKGLPGTYESTARDDGSKSKLGADFLAQMMNSWLN